ncbi:MAG: DUF6065 family protein [Alphaproteobacteria bacterium]|nr:hypothetical protein [Rhodocyclaceae bacterium]
MTTASSFGWYIFPPIGFKLMWDGSDVIWTYDGVEDWFPLTTAQFPNFAPHFDDAAPDDIKGYSPPFLSSFIEPGVLQIWSGLTMRTAPGWAALIRAPANFVRNRGYECYEGIVETSSWFGPLFINVRLTRTHHPIEFDPDFPFLQVQPIPQEAYGAAVENFSIIENLSDFGEADWNDFRHTVVRPNKVPHRKLGDYAVNLRKTQRAKERDDTAKE